MKDDIEALQADVADHSISVTALLQRAIVLASRRGDDRFVAWARQELKGYTKDDKEVEYRRLKGKYVVVQPDNRPVPIQWHSSASGMDARFITLPLPEIESHIPSEADSFAVEIQVDSQFRASLRLEPGDRACFQVVRATVAGFLQEIRNKVLDWTLGLSAGEDVVDTPLLSSSQQGDVASSAATIFYSWQSDLPNATNRAFIEGCLERAIKELKADCTLHVDPCLDRDTQNVPGSPDIASTIFDKIDNCGLFVCDVSFVNPNSSERQTPNPNVLIELGYAVKTLGWSRIVCVFNSAFGRIEDLPFDLRQRRVRSYIVHEGDEKADQRKLLAGLLKADIQGIFDAMLPKPSTGDTDTHSIRFAVDDWTVWREEDHDLGAAVIVNGWREGCPRYSCTVRLRNELTAEEQIHRLRMEFRQGDKVLLSDTYAFADGVVALPPKKWVSLDVDYGLHDDGVFAASESVWFVAETVGDNNKVEWRVATIKGSLAGLEKRPFR